MNKEELENKKQALIAKYTMLIGRMDQLTQEMKSVNNESLMIKGAINLIDEQIAKKNKKEEPHIKEISKENKNKK